MTRPPAVRMWEGQEPNMTRTPLFIFLVVVLAGAVLAEPVAVTGIKAVHRNGQTFVTWTDAAEGEAGANFRYAVLSSAEPITQANRTKATLCMKGVFNNSAKLFGHAFWPPQRLDPKTPTCTIVEGGEPLPDSSGLAVVTVQADGNRYYAVVATNLAGKALSRIVPRQSAIAEPVAEKVGDIRPIKLHDSKSYGRYARQCQVTGK